MTNFDFRVRAWWSLLYHIALFINRLDGLNIVYGYKKTQGEPGFILIFLSAETKA